MTPPMPPLDELVPFASTSSASQDAFASAFSGRLPIFGRRNSLPVLPIPYSLDPPNLFQNPYIEPRPIPPDWKPYEIPRIRHHSAPLSQPPSPVEPFSSRTESSNATIQGGDSDEESSGSPGTEGADGKKKQRKRRRRAGEPPRDWEARRYQCTYCDKWFARPSARVTHERTHTNTRPAVCPEPTCMRAFAVASNLRRHQRVFKHYEPGTGPSPEESGPVDSETPAATAPPDAQVS